MTFAERLRNLRTEMGESQSELGVLIDVSRQTIGNYESGSRFPNDDNVIIELSKHFNVSIDYLFGVSDVRAVPDNTGEDSFSNMSKKDIIKSIDFLLEEYTYTELSKIFKALKVLCSKKDL